MNNESIVANMTDIYQLIAHNNYVVPTYQRQYAWKSQNLMDLWIDLIDIVDGVQKSHFIGQIVTYMDGDIQDIIDGQQRLTTIAILFASIKSVAEDLLENNNLNHNPEYEAKRIIDDIHDIVKWDSDNPFLKLQPYKRGDNCIHEYLIGLFSKKNINAKNAPNIEPIKKIKSAHSFFKSHINTYFSENNATTPPEKLGILKMILDSIKNNLIVSKVTTRVKEDAFVIYQSLNSKGEGLEVSEIIKSHVMSQVVNDSDDIQKYISNKWDELSSEFKDDSKKNSKYIRTYWISTRRFVTLNQLFRTISQEIRGTEKTKLFLDDLTKLVRYYTALNNGLKTKRDKEVFGDKTLISLLSVLNHIGAMLHYPLVLAMILRGISEEDQKKVIYKTLSVFIRHVSIAKKGTNVFEKAFASIARKIWDQELTNVDDINNEISKKLLLSDLETENAFKGLSIERKQGEKIWTIKYILFSIYSAFGDFDGIDLSDVGFDNLEVVSIQQEDNLEEGYFNYIGNMALVEKSLVEKTINLEFEIADVLSKSKYKMNNMVAEVLNNREWTVNDVISRQNSFAKQSIQIW